MHQSLYTCVMGIYRQRLEPSSHCRRCGNIFLPLEDDFVQQWARHLGEITREIRNCEAHILENCLQHTFHQSGVTRDGRPIRSSSCTFRPSVNCPHHRLAILESRSCRETISVQSFSSNAVQLLLASQDWNCTSLLPQTLLYHYACALPSTSHAISGRDWNWLSGWTS